MAGTKNNVITYHFQGETLDLENAIKRVSSTLRSATIGLNKFQEGGMTSMQRADMKRARELNDYLRKMSKRKRTWTKEETAAVKAAAGEALRISQRMERARLRAEDAAATRIRKKEAADKRRDDAQAEREAKERAEAMTPGGQLIAKNQASTLQTLSKALNPDDSVDKAVIDQISAVTGEFYAAREAMDGSVESQDRLARATVALNNAYKELSTTLRRLNAEQEAAQPKKKKNMGFFGFMASKTKSLAMYKIIKAFLAKVANALMDAFAKIADKFEPFNKAMSRFVSTFKWVVNNIATLAMALVQILAPVFETIGETIRDLTNTLNDFFAVLAGNDAVIDATYQVEDYATAVKKTKQPKGIDELNKLNEDTDAFQIRSLVDTFGGLKSISEYLKPFLDYVIAVTKQINKAIKTILERVSPLLDKVLSLIDMFHELIGPSSQEALDGILFCITQIVGLVADLVTQLLPVLMPILTIIAAVTRVINELLADVFKLVGWIIRILSPLLSGLLFAIAVPLGAILSIIAQIVYLVEALIKTILQVITFQWHKIGDTWKDFASNSGRLWNDYALTVSNSYNALGTSANNMVAPDTYMANGGVVTKPTLAMIGEGGNSEAVIPLGNSPQFEGMQEGLASAVLSALSGANRATPSSSGQPVVLSIDGRTLARALWPNLIDTQHQVGVKLK